MLLIHKKKTNQDPNFDGHSFLHISYNFSSAILTKQVRAISIGKSMIWSDSWHKYHERYFKIVLHNFTSR